MKKWFTATPNDLIAIVLTAVVIYIALVVLTRISGKRSFSKMSSFDFAMTVAIGSIIATVVISKSVSLAHGVMGMLSVYIIQIGAAWLRRYNAFQKLVDNEPLLLMDGETILHENLKTAKVTVSDLKAKLREANVIRLNQVKAVVFESTGDISVLHSDNSDIIVESWLLEGVHT